MGDVLLIRYAILFTVIVWYKKTVHQFAGQIMAKDLALSLFANESNGCWIW